MWGKPEMFQLCIMGYKKITTQNIYFNWEGNNELKILSLKIEISSMIYDLLLIVFAIREK